MVTSPFEIHHAVEEELKALDRPEFHSARELEIYREKGDLGPRTRLANLLAKKAILDKLALPLEPNAREVVVDRLTSQGFGFGMPVARLGETLREKWKASVGGTPHVSLSHDGDRYVVALTSETSEARRIGVDVMSVESIDELHRSGALAAYTSDQERQALDALPESGRKKDYVLALWCLKEAVFKSIASDNLLGANNRFRHIQASPKKDVEGPWSVEILADDEPLQFRGRWYPRLREIFHDLGLDPARIEASFQKIDARFGLAVVTLTKK